MNIIKSDIVSLHGVAISMIGGRPENQDDMAYLDTPLGFLIIVCDGMGGGPGGKTASYIVKHEIAETLCECGQQTARDHALKMAAARAHKALEDKMIENPALNGMGSTFVAVLINSQSAVIAHAGDSRCYRLHGKKCLFRSQDHSLVAELVRKKVMTEEDARMSPQANVITRGLGSTNNHVPEIEEIPYKKGDRFVLCTDGVWGAMQHQKLLKVFTQPIEQQKLLSDLSAQVDKIGFAKGGGHDNHTIAMFELEKDSQLKDSFSWKNKILYVLAILCILVLILLCIKDFVLTQKDFNSNTQEYKSTIKFNKYIYSDDTQNGNATSDPHLAGDKENQDTGFVKNSDIDTSSAKWEIDEVVSGEYVREQKAGTIIGDKRDSKNIQNKKTLLRQDVPQEIIDCLSNAKNVKEKNLKAAQIKMGEYHDKVLQLTDSLEIRTTDKRILHKVAIFKNNVSQEKLWWIDGNKNIEGFYCTLYPKVIDKYSADMVEIKKSLEQVTE